MLWFDVEKRYNTTEHCDGGFLKELWFDVEKRYNTTELYNKNKIVSCGLM